MTIIYCPLCLALSSLSLSLPLPRYEQRAVHYLLGTEVWRQRPKLKLYDASASRAFLTHITFVPQCTFNSYSMHPLETRGDRDASQYVDGDFIIHMAGKKGQIKIAMLEHYLDNAGKAKGGRVESEARSRRASR